MISAAFVDVSGVEVPAGAASFEHDLEHDMIVFRATLQVYGSFVFEKVIWYLDGVPMQYMPQPLTTRCTVHTGDTMTARWDVYL